MDILLLVNTVIVCTASFKLSFSSCVHVDLNPNRLLFPFVLPISAACSASIVVIVPDFGYQAIGFGYQVTLNW